MNKIFKSLLLSTVALFLFSGSAFAATSVRLQTPPSKLNDDRLSLTFVTQSTSGNSIAIQCYRKGPSDISFVADGGSFNFSSPGNTDRCEFVLGQGEGIYEFRVSADAGEGVVLSTVSTDHVTTRPDAPINYKKEKISECTYEISFRTANDNGKTVKVALYRSTTPNFSLDAGHRVSEINIGSDTNGSITNGVNPNCADTYYYVIRAFDLAGNPSLPVGDSNTIVINPTTAPGQGAIPVSGGGSAVGGGATGEPTVTKEPSEEVLGEGTVNGEDTQVGQNPVSSLFTWVMGHKKISLTVLAFAILGTYLALKYRKNKSV